MRLGIEQTQAAREANASHGASRPRPGSVYAAPLAANAGVQADADTLPVLPSTLLGLELLAQRPAFDLRAATRLVRDDAGAVLRVFRLLAQDCLDEAEPPMRLEAGVAGLSRERLLHGLAGARGSQRTSRFGSFAEHGVAVARSAEMVAGTLGLPAASARLVGLLHELGHAPAILGWRAWPADAAVCCDRLARAHGLPATLRQALDEVHREARVSVWSAVVAAAHELLLRRA